MIRDTQGLLKALKFSFLNSRLTTIRYYWTIQALKETKKIYQDVQDKVLPKGNAPATECVQNKKNRRLCSSKLEVESTNVISEACLTWDEWY